jgi:hypothetical protein
VVPVTAVRRGAKGTFCSWSAQITSPICAASAQAPPSATASQSSRGLRG